MNQKVTQVGGASVPYLSKGDSPTLLIHAGTHGDESGVIESVRKAVLKYENQLPEFIYVPIVSPSAVFSRSRTNESGVDINRSCYENTTDDEIKANFEIVKGKKFDLFITFHEDPDKDSQFYLYDIAAGIGKREEWKSFTAELSKMGVGLLNGEDDSSDPILDFTFKDGYRYWDSPVEGHDGGSYDAWAIRNNIVHKALIPEIPGGLSQTDKDRVVDLFFSLFLI